MAKEVRRSAGPNVQPNLCQYPGPQTMYIRDGSLYVRARGETAPPPYLAGQQARVAQVEGLRGVSIIIPILGDYGNLTYSSLLTQFHDATPKHFQCVEIKSRVPGEHVSEIWILNRSPRHLTLLVADIRS